MKEKRTKQYVKVFNVCTIKDESPINKEEFDTFSEKFEKVRKLYLTENGEKFYSFRSIIKEIQRSAHNAGLKAKLVPVKYNSLIYSANVTGRNVNDINLVVFIEGCKDQFRVKQIQCVEVNTDRLFVNFKFPDDDIMYKYKEERKDENANEYFYRCINY